MKTYGHRRAILIAGIALLLPAVGFAACGGIDLRDSLPPELVAEAHERAARLPFHDGIAFEAARGESLVTLFGTIHLSDPAVAIPDELAARIRRADLLLVEVTTADSALVEQEIFSNPSLLLDVEGPGLRSRLTDAEWELLTEQLAPLEMPAEFIDFLRPWVATMLLEVPACEVIARRDGAVALDRRIETLAGEHGVATAGLDDALQVLAFFTDASEEMQLDMLRMSLTTGGAAAEDLLATAVASWLDEQPQVLWEIIRMQNAMLVDDLEKLDELYRRVDHYLLAERNAAWLAAILERGPEAPEMVVAVGARHLAGADGLPSLLRAEGFTIARLDMF